VKVAYVLCYANNTKKGPINWHCFLTSAPVDLSNLVLFIAVFNVPVQDASVLEHSNKLQSLPSTLLNAFSSIMYAVIYPTLHI